MNLRTKDNLGSHRSDPIRQYRFDHTKLSIHQKKQLFF